MNLLFAGAKLYWRIFRPINFAVQAMLIRDEQVVLVRHSYKPGWFFPGGGGISGDNGGDLYQPGSGYDTSRF